MPSMPNPAFAASQSSTPALHAFSSEIQKDDRLDSFLTGYRTKTYPPAPTYCKRTVLVYLPPPSLQTTQPPAKADGFELRTESPDARRLNDASYSGSILKLSFGFGSK